jgi:hypothetical protein
MNSKTRRIILHILGCLFFLSLPVFFSRDFSSSFSFIRIPPFQRDFLSYCVLLLFFYANSFFFLPNFYFHKKYAVYSVCIILSFLIVIFLPVLLIPFHINSGGYAPAHFEQMPHHREPNNFLMHLLIGPHFFQFLIITIFSYSLSINGRWRESEKARVDTELAYLKAQINPHFLFNTLNSIYALAIEQSEKTAAAVVQLSGMMRYVITETANEFVPLSKEIAYIKDYIELQKIRLDTNVKMQFSVIGDTMGERIAPMLLIPFIENAFKYGVSPDEESDIVVMITIESHELKLFVRNIKVYKQVLQQEQSGLGINNTKNRLKLLYPDKHYLNISNEDKDFQIFLSIFMR